MTDPVPAGPLDAEPFDVPTDQHAALLATLAAAGVQLGDHDRRIAEWLAASPGMGWGVVAAIASWVKQAGDTASASETTEPDDQTPLCAVEPCALPRPDIVVNPGAGRPPLLACELHASWLLAAVPGSTAEANPDLPVTPGAQSTSAIRLDLNLVRSMARALTEEHDRKHDGTWACPLCDPSRLPATA